MTVQLEIQDGNPWYLSPDVWTADIAGTPSLPVAGTATHLWARVRNNGKSLAQDATVRFYWGNPAVGVTRVTATLVGSAFVTLNSGETKEVLCLTPWVPIYVNNGHECVLAEAFHSADPLPPGPAFNVPTDRHVAQRNLSVVNAAASMMFFMPFEIHNPSRKEATFRIRAVVGEMNELKPLRAHFGKDLPKLKEGRFEKLGFSLERCPSERDVATTVPELVRVNVPPRGRSGATLLGKISGGAALVHVLQYLDDATVGGLSVLVLAGKE
jgi:hypothetical protein